MLTQEEVRKIATLARIALSDAEVEKFQRDLSAVLDYVAELNQVAIDGVAEVSQVTGLVNVQRSDVAVRTEHRDAILGQAPETKDDFFKVKAIL